MLFLPFCLFLFFVLDGSCAGTDYAADKQEYADQYEEAWKEYALVVGRVVKVEEYAEADE